MKPVMGRLALFGLALTSLAGSHALAADFDPRPLEAAVAEAEGSLHARIGVSVIDTETGATWSHKGGERFPMNSTFKSFLCAALLDAAQKEEADLSRSVTIEESDIVRYSPVTEKRVGGSPFTLEQLCETTVTYSDNAAANIVLEEIGGPEGLTAYLRSIGDTVTRSDRPEPDSNSGIPGDPRDTTTPDAAAETLRKTVLADALSKPDRRKLASWLVDNKVGDKTLRAGLPKDWVIADKTGAGANGSRNDIGVIWPEGRKPVVIAVYITQTKAAFDDRNKAIADIAAALVQSLKD
ncbi:class A beta-lactamase [Rhodobacterales bacterium]|nr:class A beta-lactamase [Rhodobacterales bacterium]